MLPASPAALQLPIRRLTPADVPACVDLAADRGGAPEVSKWRLHFMVSDVFGVDDPGGEGLAAMVVLTRYGPAFAVIGMMVVASRYGRQGLGRRLMLHVMAAAGPAVVYLTATSFGRPLYERLGFVPLDSITRHVGVFTGASGPAGPGQAGPGQAGPGQGGPGQAGGGASPAARPGRQASAADLPAILATDLAVFGAERGALLSELVTFADVFLVSGPAGSAGPSYGAAWQNGDIRFIRPVVGAGPAIAQELIGQLASAGGWSGQVRLDVLGQHGELAAWAVARGLVPGEPSTVM